jgi:hypothetical protein
MGPGFEHGCDDSLWCTLLTPHHLFGLRHRRRIAPSAWQSHSFGSWPPKTDALAAQTQLVQVKCLALDCITFRKLLSTAAVARRIAVVKWLSHVPEFKSLQSSDLVQLVDSLESRSFREGETIVQQVNHTRTHTHTHTHTLPTRSRERVCAPSQPDKQPERIRKARRLSDPTTSTFASLFWMVLVKACRLSTWSTS